MIVVLMQELFSSHVAWPHGLRSGIASLAPRAGCESSPRSRVPPANPIRLVILTLVRSLVWCAWLCLFPNTFLAQDYRVSLSVSPFTEIVLNSGTSFRDGGITATTVEGVQRLFMSHGSNEVYARIATTQKYRTGFGDHSMDRGLERARMAAALHLPFNPELGLFRIYGDIRCQPAPDFTGYPAIKLPGPWASLSLDQMAAALRAYGAAAARQILATGVQVRIWILATKSNLALPALPSSRYREVATIPSARRIGIKRRMR